MELLIICTCFVNTKMAHKKESNIGRVVSNSIIQSMIKMARYIVTKLSHSIPLDNIEGKREI